MKASNLLHSIFACSICIIAIACHAQDASVVDTTSFDELIEHPWFIEYRDIDRRQSDMALYKETDMDAISQLFAKDFDPCDIDGRANLDYIPRVDEYMDLMCRRVQLHAKIMAKYPYIREFTEEQRITLLSGTERLTSQEIEQLQEIRRTAKPDH